MTNQDNETQNTEKQDLADRVDHLEETISKMLPTRRDALKFGGAAALGGAAMSGRASAGTSEVGTIGTSTDLVDINAEDISAAAIETDKSITVTGGEATDTIHYGSGQDRANAGDESVALGIRAQAPGDDGAGNPIGGHTVVGFAAAENNTGTDVTASGFRAARDNTGNAVTASGLRAAANNTGFGVTASGFAAAENNTGTDVTASGFRAARGDGLADPTTMGSDNIGIGVAAIRNNQASGLIAIGQQAGINAQTDDQLIITDRNGNRRMVMDLTNGNLNIDGTLTENATL